MFTSFVHFVTMDYTRDALVICVPVFHFTTLGEFSQRKIAALSN